MPDVKWYAGSSTTGTGTTFASTITPTVSDGAALGTAALPWSDLFLASGAVINFNNGDVTITHTADTLTIAGGTLTTDAISAASVSATTDFNGSRHVRAGAPNNSNAFYWSSGPQMVATSAAAVTLTDSGGNLTSPLATFKSACVNIGSSATTPASFYLVIGGVTGAGGTPTTAHLNAGSGVAIYTQEAHDAEATKLVFAYNLGGSMRYITIPLDGTTTALTHNATRP